MDKKQPPTVEEIIQKSLEEAKKSTDTVEKDLSDMLTPHRDWSPVPQEHSTTTAYSATDLNNTAQDHSTMTAFSPASHSPAVSTGSTAHSRTPGSNRRVSPNRGRVLNEETRSRPSTCRSDIVNNSTRQNKNEKHSSVASVEMPRQVTPLRSTATAVSPYGTPAARSIQRTPASRKASQNSSRGGSFATKPTGRLFPAGGTTPANRSTMSTNTVAGFTPQNRRTPGSRVSTAAGTTPASRLGGSAKSVRTALGNATPASRMSTAVGGTPASRLSTAGTNTPATRMSTPYGSTPASRHMSQRSTRTVGNTPNPEPARWPGTTPTSRPPMGSSLSSAKSTRTAVGTPGNNFNARTPRPMGNSMISAKSTKTAVSNSQLSTATPASRMGCGRTPGSKAAVPSTRNNTPVSENKRAASTKTAKESGPTSTPRRKPVDSSRRRRNKKAAKSNSTTTAISTNGLSAVTARSMSHPPVSGTVITLNDVHSSPARTAVALSYPNTPESGFRAERNGPLTARSRSLTPAARVEKSMTSTAKETKPHERTIAALHTGSVFGRSKVKQEQETSPLKIIETTSFCNTPQMEPLSGMETARAPATQNLSFRSPSRRANSVNTAITPNGISAITARSIRSTSPATAITPGGLDAVTAKSIFTPKSSQSQKGARKSLLPKVQVSLPNKSTKSAKSVKSAKSGKSVKSEKAKTEKKSRVVSKKGLSQMSASTAKSFKLPNTPKTRNIEPEMLEEARGQQSQVVVTNTLPDGSFKVVVQLTVKVAAGGRVALAGRAPQGMVTKKVAVNGASIYQS